ncbi:hypothetical protein TUBRATIS_23130 [Tubulinosema ratisbonensis]|uniref:Uncharacterized protein n=1 Tax=Tubulinosema ratisbonensis TaxID=291195 RepID=A0A437AJF4_9MICR|nr:hypothetical protein TUBRATIS_23130 [Tubulinosema ratisbonensis]
MAKEFEKIVRHKFKKVCKDFLSLTQLIASLHKKLIIVFEKKTILLNFISRIYDLNDLNPAIKKVIAKYKFYNRETENSFLSILNAVKYSLNDGFELNKNLFLTEIKKYNIQDNTLKLFYDCEENVYSIIRAIELFNSSRM